MANASIHRNMLEVAGDLTIELCPQDGIHPISLEEDTHLSTNVGCILPKTGNERVLFSLLQILQKPYTQGIPRLTLSLFEAVSSQRPAS